MDGPRRSAPHFTWAAALAFGIAGCGGNGEASQGATPVGGGAPAPLGGAAVCGLLDDNSPGRKIYVDERSPADDGPSCGTTTATACRTIQRGIANCGDPGCSVLVRHGLYETQATIVVTPGTSLYGGCRFDGEPDRGYRTTIHAVPPPGRPDSPISPVLIADGGHVPTMPFTVAGLVVVGRDETTAGTASIAMAVTRTRAARLDRLVLSAGRGGDGTAGASTAAPGGNGEQGGNAKLSGGYSNHLPGEGGRSCPSNHVGTAGNGGKGQVGKEAHDFCSHGPQENGASSGNARGGTAGTKGDNGIYCPDRPHDYPGNGGPGGNGEPGECGAKATRATAALGWITDGTTWSSGNVVWSPSNGSDGQAGAVGAGGGSGGVGGNCSRAYVSEEGYEGFPGGGGGGGGCGGGPGKGGQQGGASLPLVVSGATVVYGDNAYMPGPGGAGGTGGDGKSGGAGGGGGSGIHAGQWYWARTAHWCPGLSGDGGVGAPGGTGSGGAGGNGGPSVAVALAGGSNPPPSSSGAYPGQPGAKGQGGAGGGFTCMAGPTYNICSCQGQDGEDGAPGRGAGAASIDFDRARDHTLAGGEQLAVGQFLWSPGRNHYVVLEANSNFVLRRADGTKVWASETR